MLFYVSTELFRFGIEYSVPEKMERENFQNSLPISCQFNLLLIKYLQVSLKGFLSSQLFLSSHSTSHINVTLANLYIDIDIDKGVDVDVDISIDIYPHYYFHSHQPWSEMCHKIHLLATY